MINFTNSLNDIDPDTNFLNFEQSNSSCKYQTLQEFTTNFLSNENFYNFFLINFNIRSFPRNHDHLEAFLDCLPKFPDVLVLTETWNSSQNLNLCKISNFEGTHVYRSGTQRSGGVSIFISNQYKFEQIPSLCFVNEVMEVCAVSVKMGNNPIVILGIYRPCSGDESSFLSSLEDLLQSSFIRNKGVILSGDMNIDLNSINSVFQNNYVSLLNSHMFLPAITKPTRFPLGDQNHTPSNLDHIFYNQLLPFQSGIIYQDITDHLPTYINIKLGNIIKNEFKKIEFRPFSLSNFNSLTSKISSTNWNFLFTSGDVHSAFQLFTDTINKLYCECFPLKIKYLSTKRLSKPWLSSHILYQIKLKSLYFKQFKSGLISKNVNDKFKYKVQKLVTNAKNNFIAKKFEDSKNDMRKTWEVLNKLAGRKVTANEIDELLYKGVTVSNDQDIANNFNDHFCNIAGMLEEKLPRNDLSPTMFANSRNSSSFFLFPVDENECEKIINKLKPTKNSINMIPVKIFISLREYLKFPLTKLINMSFEKSTFPISLKSARLTPVFKKGEKILPENYRPIASLPFLSKVLEKCMINRIIKFYDRTKFFSKFQFGFRKGFSTVHALTELTENI